MIVNWINPVNRNYSLNRGLVAWYLVTPNNRGGLLFRDLVSKYDATLTNMDPATDWVVAGDRPSGFGAIDMDGSDDSLIPASFSKIKAIEQGITVSAWIKPSTITGRRDVVAHWLASGTNRHFLLLHSSSANGKVLFAISTIGSDTISIDSVDVLIINEWTFIAGTYDQANLKCFINGIEENTVAQTGTLHTTASAVYQLGNSFAAGVDYGGLIDDVRIYDRSLSNADILLLYQLSKNGYGSLLNRIRPIAKAVGGLSIPVAMHHYTKNIGAA